MKNNSVYGFLVLTNIILFSALFGFVYWIRTTVINLLQTLQELSPQLALLEQTLQQGQTPEQLGELSAVLSQISTTTNTALFLAVIVLPLGIITLWSLAHSIEYSLQTRTRYSIKRFLTFLAVTIPFAIILILIFSQLLSLLAPLREHFIEPSLTSFFILVVLALLTMVFLHVFYSVYPQRTLKQAFTLFKERIKNKWYTVIPLGVFISILYLPLLYFFVLFYLAITQGTSLVSPLIGSVVLILLLTGTKYFFSRLLIPRQD